MVEDIIPLAALAFAISGVAGTEWMVRRGIVAHVRRQMNAIAGQAALPAVPSEPQVPAAGSPRIVRWTMVDVPSDAYAVEMAWEARAVGILNRLLRTDLLFAGVYLAIPLMVGLTAPADMRGIMWVGVMLAVVLAGFALARHALGLHRLDALDPLLESSRFDPLWKRSLKRTAIGMACVLIFVVGMVISFALIAVMPLWWVMRRVAAESTEAFVTGVQVLLSAAFVAFAALLALVFLVGSPSWTGNLAGAVMLLAVGRHAWTLVSQARALRRTLGSALLVLRVFNQQQSTAFIFDRLIRLWRYFGHHFTVVDGSLVQASGRHRLGWMSRIGLLLCLGMASILGFTAAAGGAEPGAAVLFAALLSTMVAAAVTSLLIIAVARWRIDRRFIRNRDQLLARLRRLDERPRNLDLTYRHERAMCHDDTWFMAVDEFARRADVVLMDLRGFSATNKGCETEIEYLFDTIAAEHIVFLVDDRNPAEIDALLARCWSLQNPRSPNLHDPEPELTLYVASDAFDKVDHRAVMRTLMLRANVNFQARLAARSAGSVLDSTPEPQRSQTPAASSS